LTQLGYYVRIYFKFIERLRDVRKKSICVMDEFSTMNAGTPCTVCAYEQGGRAVVLLDRNAKVLRMNPAAERLLGPDFKIVSKRLCSVDPKATAALNLALHTLIGSNESTSVIPPILLPRANRRPLLIHAMRPPAICERARAPCRAVLVLIDPDTHYFPPESALKSYFGLSIAEARLAQRLASGEALEDAANHLGISKHTARVQLKAVFAKVNVHRQAELVALLAQLMDLPNPASRA
jgi:DNA-binding CsgD family transcriptional regulator